MKIQLDNNDAAILGELMNLHGNDLMTKMGSRCLLVYDKFRKLTIKLRFANRKTSIKLDMHTAQMMHEFLSLLPTDIYAQWSYIHIQIQKYVADSHKDIMNRGLT